MKNMKKLFAMALAVIMVLTLATTTFATMQGDLDGGSITINDAVSGNTYNAYQILYLESYNSTANTYTYKANSDWAEWLANDASAYVEIDTQGYVTWKDGANVAQFAELAKEKAATLTPDATANASTNTVQMTGLKLGYYLVDTTLGTLCSLDTTNPSVEMNEKNEVPVTIKEVKEDSTGVWGETNDAGIGETVEFKATITVEAGAVNYILHDRMSAGLTYQGVSSVKIGDDVVASSNYSVELTNKCADDCTFEVVFDNDYIKTLAVDTQITVYYSAVVNENAVIAGAGNPNKVDLSYGEKLTPDRTPEDTTITYVWELPVFKYTGTNTPLAGAVFSLYTDAGCTKIVNLTTTATTNVYKVKTDGTVTEITTDANGKFEIEGLDSGTYYLKEITAPAGYNKLAGPVTVIIDNQGHVQQNGDQVDEFGVQNNAGTELPSTGGIGTTLFYLFGGVMVVGAAVLLVTKKRMAA